MRIVCDIPFEVTESGGEEKTYVGDPARVCRWIAQNPSTRVLCIKSWDATKNITVAIVKTTEGVE